MSNKGKSNFCKNWGREEVGFSGTRNGVETKQLRAVRRSGRRAAMWQRAAEPWLRRTDAGSTIDCGRAAITTTLQQRSQHDYLTTPRPRFEPAMADKGTYCWFSRLPMASAAGCRTFSEQICCLRRTTWSSGGWSFLWVRNGRAHDPELHRYFTFLVTTLALALDYLTSSTFYRVTKGLVGCATRIGTVYDRDICSGKFYKTILLNFQILHH